MAQALRPGKARTPARQRPRPGRLTLSILSIQSAVVYGHVGNSAAVFPLQRLGMEVWAVDTVQFSNHPGYGAWEGMSFTGEAIRALVDGLAARGMNLAYFGLLSHAIGRGIGPAFLRAAIDEA